MNIKLLKQVKRHILAEPERFRMDDWNCGTAQCIGGWACSLAGLKWKRSGEGTHRELATEAEVSKVAALLLDIEAEDCPESIYGDDSEAARLFYTSSWPDEFRHQYEEAEDRRARARIAAERIDHFIATNGAE
jgi:hypothetical protein